MTTAWFNNDDDRSPIQRDCDEATRISNERKEKHLVKLSWPSLQILIDTWIDTFFKRQRIFTDKNEFRIELETVIEEYVGYYKSSQKNILDKGVRKRMKDICIAYHELLYDGEIDPYKGVNTPEQERIINQIGARTETDRVMDWKPKKEQ